MGSRNHISLRPALDGRANCIAGSSGNADEEFAVPATRRASHAQSTAYSPNPKLHQARCAASVKCGSIMTGYMARPSSEPAFDSPKRRYGTLPPRLRAHHTCNRGLAAASARNGSPMLPERNRKIVRTGCSAAHMAFHCTSIPSAPIATGEAHAKASNYSPRQAPRDADPARARYARHPVGVEISQQQHDLKEDQAGYPDRRRASQHRKQLLLRPWAQGQIAETPRERPSHRTPNASIAYAHQNSLSRLSTSGWPVRLVWRVQFASGIISIQICPLSPAASPPPSLSQTRPLECSCMFATRLAAVLLSSAIALPLFAAPAPKAVAQRRLVTVTDDGQGMDDLERLPPDDPGEQAQR